MQEIGANGKGRGTKKRKEETARRVEGKSTWHSSHYARVLLARFIFLTARRCHGLGGKTKRVSRESVSNFPHRRKHDQSCPRQRGPSRPPPLPFDPFRALSARAIHDSTLFSPRSPLLVVFDDNEFRILVFPLLLPLLRYDRRTDARDVTNRKCCHRLSRQNGIDEIEVSDLSKSAFFRKDYISLDAPVTLPGRCIMSLQKTGERFAVVGAKKFQGAGRY